jgi:hypothetical protein
MLTKPPPYHQLSLYKAILTALIAAGQRLEVPHWPIDYEPSIRASGRGLRLAAERSAPMDWNSFTVRARAAGRQAGAPRRGHIASWSN